MAIGQQQWILVHKSVLRTCQVINHLVQFQQLIYQVNSINQSRKERAQIDEIHVHWAHGASVDQWKQHVLLIRPFHAWHCRLLLSHVSNGHDSLVNIHMRICLRLHVH